MKRRKPQSTSTASPRTGRAGSRAADAVPSAPAERLLTIGEVAYKLRVSRGTVYYLVRCGDLPGVRVRRTLRIRRLDLERYVKRHGIRTHHPRLSLRLTGRNT